MDEEKVKLVQRQFLIEILSDFNRSQLEGKGFDFYFVLRNKLDKLNKEKI
jgi:hypothetical protein